MYAETPGCMYADFGCIYMETVGCMYAVVGCMYMETLGCMYADVGCIYMETVGCMYAVVVWLFLLVIWEWTWHQDAMPGCAGNVVNTLVLIRFTVLEKLEF